MCKKIYLIDPATTEWNRGGYCYLPYLFYDYLKWEVEADVVFLENYTAVDRDKISDDVFEMFVVMDTPPQKDVCLELHRTYPHAKFLGYYGFIEELGLPLYKVTPEQIVAGMKHQGKSFKQLKSILLSDCDSHIQGAYQGQWYPIHTSYSCSKGCFFCPGSKNNDGRVDRLSIDVVEKKLEWFYEMGYRNIHFVDENFFLNIHRAHLILQA